jgi:ABC-2 type transport system permease protein
MNGILATFLRELRAYFLSPLAYALLFFLLLANGILFTMILVFLNDPLAPPGRPLDFFFGSSWWMLIFVGPLLTMRLLAEERKSGTIEVLMTAPVTEAQVVLGKYLAALAFFVVLWLPTLVYAGIVAFYSEIDWGVVAAGYLGVVLVGGLILSVGMLTSALTRNQVIAAVSAVALSFALYIFTVFEQAVSSQALKSAFSYMSIPDHLEELAKGIVDTRRLVFYLTTTAFFLFLTGRALESGKWR